MKNNSTRFRKFSWKECISATLVGLLLAVTPAMAFASEFYQDLGDIKVSVKLENKPVVEGLKQIESQTDIRFVYDLNQLNSLPSITLKAKKKPLIEVLRNVLSSSPLTFTQIESNIVIQTALAIGDKKSLYTPVSVRGTVKDEKGVPVPGVSVIVKGTGKGVSTDAAGNFTLNNIDANAVLVFSGIGFKTREVVLAGQSVISITLTEDIRELEQVIVVGYGTQQRKDLTGSIAVVGSERIANQTVANVGQALQGKVTGVQVTNSGDPGSNPQIRIRGVGSVTSGVNPLYVVDGVIVDNISYLGPNDIENISILKDASSAAIYGVRAANGVILVTTRKGKSGDNDKTTVYLDSYMGFKKPSNVLSMAGGQEYVTLYNEKAKYLGQTNQISLSQFNNTSTNWFDQILVNSFTQSHNININGGGKNSAFNIGAGYLRDDGLIENNKYERLSLKSNYTFTVSKFVRGGLNIVVTGSKGKPWPGGVLNESFRALPVFKGRDENGDFVNPNVYSLTGQATNPAATLFYYHRWENRVNGVGNAFIDIQPVNWLTLRSSIGVNPNSTWGVGYEPVYTVSDFQKNTTNNMDKIRSRSTNLYWDNTATFEKTFARDHHLKVLAGYSYQWQTDDNLSVSARGLKELPAIEQSFLFLNMPRIDEVYSPSINDDGNKTVSISYLSRINYDYANKYLLTLTFRADGSSRFPKNKRWGYFPSVGLGWNISEEPFMKDVSWLDFLKIRGSWGMLGNNNIPSNIYVPTVTTDAYRAVVFGVNQNTGDGVVSYPATIDMLFNSNLKWEVVKEWDGGIEAMMLKNRLSFTMDYYYRNTTDAIFPVTDIGSSGLSASGVWGNYADILNSGVELGLGWKESKTDWKYSVNANVTFNHNELKSIKKEGTIGIYRGYSDTQFLTYSTQGQPVGSFFGYKVAGVFQNAAELNSKPHLPGAQAGDLIFEDINKDNIIDARDRTFIGNPNPKCSYGFDASVGYRSFDLSLSVQGVFGNDIFNVNRLYRFGNENWDMDFYKNRWHGEGTSNSYPSAVMANPTTPSSFHVEKGDYLRVKAIQFGYNIPAKVLKKAGLTRARLYLNAENPYTAFGYNGFSPEVAGGDPLLTGTDRNVYPLSSVYTFGFNLTF